MKYITILIIVNILLQYILRYKMIYIKLGDIINMSISIFIVYFCYYIRIMSINGIDNNIIIEDSLFCIDNISFTLILLLSLLMPIVYMIDMPVFISKGGSEESKNKVIIMNILYLIMYNILITRDIFTFYILFEIMLIPLLLQIINYKTSNKKIESIYKLWYYTYGTSILMLIVIIYYYVNYGTTNMSFLSYQMTEKEINKVIIFVLFIIFMSKIPIFPLTGWLGEVHTESSTSGSVLLAGIILKIGQYGLYRFNIEMYLEEDIRYWTPFIYTLSIISIIYSTISIYYVIDLKRIIAYSSIIHMNVGIIALYSYSLESIIGTLINNITHGLISSIYFIMIGFIYNRYHTRIIFYFKGFINTMPCFSALWFLINLLNLNIPGTLSFIGELNMIIGVYKISKYIGLIIIITIITNSFYIYSLINNLMYFKITKEIQYYNDLYEKEFYILIYPFILIIFFGLFPSFFISPLFLSVLYL